MNTFHIKYVIVFAICLFVYQPALNCYAKDTAISIKSRILRQSPKIIIRSRYDFEKQISLKVRPDPRFLSSDVLIKTISELGMHDAKGVRITSGFDIDLENDLVLAFSGGISEIIKSSSSPSGLTITANFKDNNGNFISPPKDSLALYTTGGERLCFEYQEIAKTAPKMAFILLLDRSGSMTDVISDVQASARIFLNELPLSAECALASFNSSFSYHNDYFQSCNNGDFSLDNLSAGGGTELYSPLLNAYEILSREYFKDHQKAVIVITDGQISPDEEMKQKLIAGKKDILTFVYFLGDKDDDHLIGLADAFLQATSEFRKNLDQYFHSLSTAYGTQKVLKVRRCDGGNYESAK